MRFPKLAVRNLIAETTLGQRYYVTPDELLRTFPNGMNGAATVTDTIGGTGGNSGANSGLIFGFPLIPSASGRLVSIGIDVNNAAGNVRMCVYNTLGSNILSNTLSQTGDVTPSGGWFDEPVLSATITKGVPIYLGF
jgi:hypothetical protein